jgi:hypothetical protein
MDESKKVALTREKILAAKDLIIECVDVEQWGGSVYVRNLSGKGRDAFEGSRVRIRDGNKVEMIHDNTRAKLLSMTLCDESGNLLFSQEDIEALGEKDAAVLDMLFDVAQRLSGMRPVDVDTKVKNSVAVLSGNSSSGLHSL